MLQRLLIANRGEIARRIIRTCRRLGVETVAVYSDADAGAPFVAEADQASRLGPAPARESYLDVGKVLAAARAAGADSLHPGYGFLSENAAFAGAVVSAGLVWVGPPASSIRAMGLKDAAKALMSAAGVPVTPGYQGDDQTSGRLQAEADRLGYPVLIKAVAGGGGKGMRKVDAAGDFAAALASCRREAAASFGDDRVLIETYVTRPRHIEVQVFADTHGNAVHLFERDCSLQRRHQKVIEEAPAPGMDAATREAVCAAAVRAAKAVAYEGAGTVEFIADASEGLRADRIWFMEMNTRLQVEHPVTEAITGEDLVEWQLRVASGEPLPKRQDQLSMTGHAMEARLYAENPASGFLPSTGVLEHLHLPSGVRVDSAVEEGSEVTPFYDPMIAKLIAHASTREGAAAKLANACREVEVWPVKTNAAFLTRCLDEPDFVAGRVDTGFIGARHEALTAEQQPVNVTYAAAFGMAARVAAITELNNRVDLKFNEPWEATPEGLYGFRLNALPVARFQLRNRAGESLIGAIFPRPLRRGFSFEYDVELNGHRFSFLTDESRRGGAVDGQHVSTFVENDEVVVAFQSGEAFEFTFPAISADGDMSAGSDGEITSPMPGRVVAVQVAKGDRVAKGAPLLTLEAMKMEHVLTAPFDAMVAELDAEAGGQVAEGVVLVKLDAVEP
ncbi:biotin carboxylase N-terminal domain-containing protein [Caulobacter sp. S45]|uniref:ATP-binding protein n=1 Tax=Caulobacter sp. S45 TaxID=1641861 RepID=UPI001575D310|nr:biotin carboxylase N-terminal domain-containing protein [Caulobacter sp. S45]